MEKILKILEDNARLSLEEIAVMAGVTSQEVGAAIDSYAKKGIIKGYGTIIDWDKVEVKRVKALIDLKVRPKKGDGFDEVATRLAQLSEVDSVMLMSGGYDISMVMKGTSFQDIAMFVAMRLSVMDDILETATHFVLKTYKSHGQMFAADNTDERGLSS